MHKYSSITRNRLYRDNTRDYLLKLNFESFGFNGKKTSPLFPLFFLREAFIDMKKNSHMHTCNKLAVNISQFP